MFIRKNILYLQRNCDIFTHKLSIYLIFACFSFAKLVNLLLDRGYSKKEVYSTVIDLEMEFSWNENFSKEMEKRNINIFK